jgi:YggT family protein
MDGSYSVAIITTVIDILEYYIYIVIAAAVASWLIALGVINTHNRGVARVVDILYRLTEPALRPIQRVLPNFGGIDISPIVLFFIIKLIQKLLFTFAINLGAY